MKLVYAADLHGDRGAYASLTRLAVAEQPAAVILGGDLFTYSPQAASQMIFAEGPLRAHLHEAPDLSGRWAERIGATICTNPGPAAGATFRAVLVDTAALPGSLRHTLWGESGCV
jgi:Icc-related predicted phosphoesterase